MYDEVVKRDLEVLDRRETGLLHAVPALHDGVVLAEPHEVERVVLLVAVRGCQHVAGVDQVAATVEPVAVFLQSVIELSISGQTLPHLLLVPHPEEGGEGKLSDLGGLSSQDEL